MKIKTAIKIAKNDNVATALTDLNMGQIVEIVEESESIGTVLCEDIPAYHKFALSNFKIGDKVYKYGQVIGQVISEIKVGEHVHVHNIKSLRGGKSEV